MKIQNNAAAASMLRTEIIHTLGGGGSSLAVAYVPDPQQGVHLLTTEALIDFDRWDWNGMRVGDRARFVDNIHHHRWHHSSGMSIQWEPMALANVEADPELYITGFVAVPGRIGSYRFQETFLILGVQSHPDMGLYHNLGPLGVAPGGIGAYPIFLYWPPMVQLVPEVEAV